MKGLHRWLVPAGTSVLVRVATAAISLIVLKLTYTLLPPHDFARFNVILTVVAVCAALAAPINRQFWANNNSENYGRSIVATAIVGIITITIAWLVLPSHSFAGDAQLALLLTVYFYTSVRAIERYTYGRMLFVRSFLAGLLISFAFVLVELVSVLILYGLNQNSLVIRLAAPAAAFLLIVIAIRPKGIGASAFATPMAIARNLPAFLRQVFYSRTAGTTLLFYVVATFSTMAERLSIGLFSDSYDESHADYLLIVSYAIAWQTLLSASLDLARKHVYHAGAWQPRASQSLVQFTLGIAGLSCSAIAAYPILKATAIIPETALLTDWAGLLVKATAIVCIQLAFTDRIQQGELGHATAWVFGIGVIAFGISAAHVAGYSPNSASTVLVAASIMLSVLTLAMTKRRHGSAA